MKWEYKLPRKDALINIISTAIDSDRSISVYYIAEQVEKYIKATHIKRKPNTYIKARFSEPVRRRW